MSYVIKGDRVTVSRACPLCGREAVVRDIPLRGFQDWMLRGKFIQEALPDLTDGQRETIISGTHEECFDVAFQEE